MPSDTTDVIVVGAGPVGIETAVALKRGGVDFLHFDAGQVGATMMWWAPQTRWFSSNERIAVAGVPLFTPDQQKATREQYLAYLRTVVRHYDLKVNSFERVTDIDRAADGFLVTTERRGRRRNYRASRVILSVGGTDRPRQLDVPGADRPHVHAYFVEPHTYFGQKLLVVGGRNSAAEAALRCFHAGAEVAISYRRDALPEDDLKYWLRPEITGLVKKGRIRAYLSTDVAEVKADAVTLRRNGGERAGESFDVPADFVLPMIGFEQDRATFERAGVELVGEQRAPYYDERTMETNVPGLYVAGTAIAGTQGRYRVFLENCHVHSERIVAAITGGAVPAEPEAVGMPES